MLCLKFMKERRCWRRSSIIDADSEGRFLFGVTWPGEWDRGQSRGLPATAKQGVMKKENGMAIKKLLDEKNGDSQIVLGIGGGSGSGKTTVAKLIAERLQDLESEQICLDRFFLPVDTLPKYYSEHHGSEQPNFNRPDSLDFTAMTAFCRTISGFDVVILEGHFALYRQEIRELMDVKCFVTIDVQEMLHRRTVRNLAANYGGSEENILHYNRECVLPMYNEHILPTAKYADILIPNSREDLSRRDEIIESLCKEIVYATNPLS